MVGPNGPFTIGVNEKGRYFAKAPRNMLDFFVTHFNEFGSRTFIVYENERYTFSQVWELSKKLSVLLQKSFGVKKGDRVSIAMRNYPEWCISFFAIALCGAVVTPLNSWWKENELAYGLEDSGSKVIFCDQQRAEYVSRIINSGNKSVSAIVVRGKFKTGGGLFAYEDIIQEVRSLASVPDDHIKQISASVQPTDPLLIMYTSGTTGNPKGVVLSHRATVNQMEMGKFLTFVGEKVAQLPGMDPVPVVEQHAILCPVPLFHVTASHHIFLQSLLVGRKLVLVWKWNAEAALKIIQDEKITNWTAVPTMAADIMDHPKFKDYDTSSLLTLGAGGAATPVSQVPKAVKQFKNAMPSSAYGLTETSGAVCVNMGYGYILTPTSVGAPFPIVETKVLDLETGQPLPPGERGELYLKSNLNMDGYWNKAEATAEVLKDGWFKTGDVAILDEFGRIFIVDRAKDIIIRGGENISCSEVETAFYSHPAVKECSVFSLPDERLGEIPGVLVFLKSPATAAELIEHVKPLLAGFKTPHVNHVYFTNQPLPRGATGKILKRAIRDKIIAEHFKIKSSL